MRLLPLSASLLAVCIARAATYYVATDGDDSNPGTESQPWRTIQKAAATLVADDTVYIKPGVYAPTSPIYPANSGQSNAWITYAALTNGTVTVDGSSANVQPDEGIFYIVDCAWIRVRGLRFINSGYAGISVESSRHIVLENNSTSNTDASGIMIWACDDVVIRSNEIRRACRGSGDVGECITLDDTTNFVVSYNHVFDVPDEPGNGGEGIDAKEASNNGSIHHNYVHDLYRLGIYVDAYGSHQSNVEVYANVVHHCADGIAVSAELPAGFLRDVRIYNNVAYENDYNGIIVSDYSDDGSEGVKQDIYVINNTVFSNGYDNTEEWGGGILVATTNPASTNIVVRNNIASENNCWQIATVRTNLLQVDHNLVFGRTDYAEDEFEFDGSFSITGDPRFVSAATRNFHLRGSSPAVDAGGASRAPTNDADAVARPQDGDLDGNPAWDIGAFEYRRPTLECPSIVSGNMTVAWSGCSGMVYRVERSDDLVSPLWSALAVVTARSSRIAVTDGVPAGPVRCYRVAEE